MAESGGYLWLSDKDRLTLTEMLSRVRNKPLGTPSVTREDVLPMTPEVYVALTPTGGIPGLSIVSLSSGTGTGTDDSQDLVMPGQAECNVYCKRETNLGDTLEQVPDLTRIVRNISVDAVEENTYVLIERDKFGDWYVEGVEPVPASSGVTTTTNICPVKNSLGYVTDIVVEYTTRDNLTGEVLAQWCVMNPAGCCGGFGTGTHLPGTGGRPGTHHGTGGVTISCCADTLPTTLYANFLSGTETCSNVYGFSIPLSYYPQFGRWYSQSFNICGDGPFFLDLYCNYAGNASPGYFYFGSYLYKYNGSDPRHTYANSSDIRQPVHCDPVDLLFTAVVPFCPNGPPAPFTPTNYLTYSITPSALFGAAIAPHCTGTAGGGGGGSGISTACCPTVQLPTTVTLTLSNPMVGCGCLAGTISLVWDGSANWVGSASLCGHTITGTMYCAGAGTGFVLTLKSDTTTFYLSSPTVPTACNPLAIHFGTGVAVGPNPCFGNITIDVSGTSGGSSTPGTVATFCCPTNLLQTTIHMTVASLSGGCSGLAGMFALVWNSTQAAWIGSIPYPGDPITLQVSCWSPDGGLTWRFLTRFIRSNGQYAISVAVAPASCSPFSVVYPNQSLTAPCTGVIGIYLS